MDSIVTRLTKYEERFLPRIGTLLDPRFKKQGFRSPFNVVQAEKFLENEVTVINNSCDSVPHAAEPPPPSQNRQTLFTFLQKNISELPTSKRADAIIDLRQYFNLKHCEENVDPLESWKHNESNLKKLLPKFLCVPATSTESERMFSKAGLVINNRRASLKANNVDILLFLQKNSWIQ
ncbi:uncharacterized protein LOC132797673 [Drosophila nasuta]|uniref:uncharacterized protein LOC132797673 n=1 Tax=Drosophila nasuta TaxID=42062 RepID=UPI00295E4DA6|nr:uncharacterized protein LOC132797673 [Drosophila nasuta]